MNITLQTSGGFAGLIGKPKRLDAEKLSPQLRAQLEQLVSSAGFHQESEQRVHPPGQADRMTNHLVLEENGGTKTLSVSEAASTPAVDALISFILQHANG